jgi:RDD family protein
MDENPYAAPRADLDGAAAESQTPLYARLGVRFRAWLIDYFLLLATFALAAGAGGALEKVPFAGAFLFGCWVLFALAYEPVMVWRTGGTVGHHVKNLHVVSERTGGRPGLFAALGRFLIKSVLGWLSFLNMLISERQQAIHDAVTGVTVRIKDPSLTRRRDYVRGRESGAP